VLTRVGARVEKSLHGPWKIRTHFHQGQRCKGSGLELTLSQLRKSHQQWKAQGGGRVV
jgi:hypothetical protein